MMARAAVVLVALLAATSAVSARKLQSGIINGLDNSALKNTLQIVVCHQPQLSFFCDLINSARADPTVALLFDPSTEATLFAPTNRGISNTQRIIKSEMGVTLDVLASTPSLAAKFVRSHIVLGATPLLTSDWRAGQVLYNSLVPQQSLTVVESSKLYAASRSFYIRSELSNGKTIDDRAGFQNMWNIIGGTGLVQELENPIVPPSFTN